jgi:sulfatase maturation enzyme AslB (radical SAM superfamily)
VGVLQISPTHPPRTLQKLIAGHEYTYDQRLDIISSGTPRPSSVYDRTQGVSRPVDLCVELTTYCNFTCANCFSSSVRGQKGIHAEIDVVEEEIRSAMPHIIRVCLTGGEPLLHPAIERLLSFPATYQDCGFVLSTNGAARVDLFPAIQAAPWLVAISLHGPKEVHNTYTKSSGFQKAERSVRQLAATNVVHLYCVLNDLLSESHLDWLLRFRDDAGAAFLRFIVPRPFGRYRPLQNVGLIMAVEERLDERSGLKTSASLTAFISADLIKRRTN